MTAHATSKAAVDAIRVELTLRRITQTQLAQGTGIEVSKLRRRLNGDVPITLDELGRIASYLSIPVASLVKAAA